MGADKYLVRRTRYLSFSRTCCLTLYKRGDFSELVEFRESIYYQLLCGEPSERVFGLGNIMIILDRRKEVPKRIAFQHVASARAVTPIQRAVFQMGDLATW